MLLAIDTATTAVTVALHDGQDVVAERTRLDARRHTELLAPAIRDVLAQAGVRPRELDVVAVGVGPGPFTGLRVGVVTARTMGHVLGIDVHAVCSLDAIAHQVVRDGLADGAFLVATDARRKELYWSRYDASALAPGEPAVDRPAELPDHARALPVAGRGSDLYPDLLGPALPVLDVSAGALAELVVARRAAGAPSLTPEPLYLRRPDAVPQTPRVPAGG